MATIDPLAKARADVRKYGWHCLHVSPHDGEEGVEFSYTIGLRESLLHPDIAIFGLDRTRSHRILNDCVETIRAGTRMPLNVPVTDILANEVPVIFKPVRPDRLERCFGTAIRYYSGTLFEVIVLFWPSKNGGFPWEEASPLQTEGLDVV